MAPLASTGVSTDLYGQASSPHYFRVGNIDTLANRATQGRWPNEDPVLDLIARITGEDISDATDASRLSEDLHLDSLGRVQLQSGDRTKTGSGITCGES